MAQETIERLQAGARCRGRPSPFVQNVTEISDKNRSEQKNDATPQLEINLPDFRNVAQGYRVVKQ
jgi:hypothetical protein